MKDEAKTAAAIMYKHDIMLPPKHSSQWADFVRQVHRQPVSAALKALSHKSKRAGDPASRHIYDIHADIRCKRRELGCCLVARS